MPDQEAQNGTTEEKIYLVASPKSWPSRPLRNALPRQRYAATAALTCVALLLLLWFLAQLQYHPWRDSTTKWAANESANAFQAPESHDSSSTTGPMHLVIFASKTNVNLCKFLLGASILGYPTPILVAWDDKFERPNYLYGGAQLAKITHGSMYLDSLPASQDNDMVLMLDGYDIWPQLPASVLLQRFERLINDTRARMEATLGSQTIQEEHLEPRVLFGAGKRCTNQAHTVGCYALAESPLPDDLYGNNTDTIIGRNFWYSQKQRYLNSGVAMGRARDMRRLFKEASRQLKQQPDHDPNDNGSHDSDFVYHGSDQSVFATMFGKQEWAREKLRLKHAKPGAKPRSSRVMGSPIDNVLYPSSTHEEFNPNLTDGNPFEFGIFLDYFSDVTHQTVNSERDATWINYSQQPLNNQVSKRHQMDCPVRIPEQLPSDVTDASIPLMEQVRWSSQWLYTHLCLSRIPVFVHHNGIKSKRETDWEWMWYQSFAGTMLAAMQKMLPADRRTYEGMRGSPRQLGAGDAWTAKGSHLDWAELCPGKWRREIFG
ncbi:MAG: hypothetical protein Q9162_003154 [Coniocarpon cinnabarinum]